MNEVIERIVQSIEKILSDGKISFSDFPELIRLITLLISLVKVIKEKS